MKAQEKPKAAPISEPPASTQAMCPSAMVTARIARLATSRRTPNRVQRVSQTPVAPATAMAATVQASDSAPMA